MSKDLPKIPKVALAIESGCGFSRGLLLGIAKYSRLHTPWAIVNILSSSYENLFSNGKLDANGIIVHSNILKNAKKLLPDRTPVILCGRIATLFPNLPRITTDDIKVGRMAADHLLDRGFRNFAFCGFGDMSWSRARGESFSKRIAKAGFKTHFKRTSIWQVQRFLEKEQLHLANWIKSLPKPLGLMSCSDERARIAIEACKIAGLNVPEDVAIIGVDNDELICGLSDPPLSSVALNTERAGYEVAELLDKLMSGDKIAGQKIIVQATQIVTRESTDILAIEDHEVASAVSFIRRHAKKVIQVGDVVAVAAVSRRVLERRFRKILHRSVLDEIRRVRVKQISRILLDTNQAMSQIALSLGYTGAEHIARYFRREMGMSPSAYRKKYGRK